MKVPWISGPWISDVAHAALIDLVEQLRERNVLRRRVLARVLEQREQREQQQDNNDPQSEISEIGVHHDVLGRHIRRHPTAYFCATNRGGLTSRTPAM